MDAVQCSKIISIKANKVNKFNTETYMTTLLLKLVLNLQ